MMTANKGPPRRSSLEYKTKDDEVASILSSEEDFDKEHGNEDPSSTDAGASSVSGSRDEVEAIKKNISRETNAVKRMRFVVILAMLLVATGITTATYIFLSNEEDSDFESSVRLHGLSDSCERFPICHRAFAHLLILSFCSLTSMLPPLWNHLNSVLRPFVTIATTFPTMSLPPPLSWERNGPMSPFRTLKSGRLTFANKLRPWGWLWHQLSNKNKPAIGPTTSWPMALGWERNLILTYSFFPPSSPAPKRVRARFNWADPCPHGPFGKSIPCLFFPLSTSMHMAILASWIWSKPHMNWEKVWPQMFCPLTFWRVCSPPSATCRPPWMNPTPPLLDPSLIHLMKPPASLWDKSWSFFVGTCTLPTSCRKM
mmetsp:Transcript_86/g.219  ORF Transcript_86/g.219 Transcript_86/m.219 type:complete len:370 (-) Transcript_86:2542-3651(-)